MKTIMRIVIILAAALLVVGVTYALGQGNSNAQRFAPRFEEFREGGGGFDEGNGEESRASTNQGLRRPNREFEGRREYEGGRDGQAYSLRSLASFGQTLIPMTIVIVLITMISRVDKWRKRSQKASASAG